MKHAVTFALGVLVALLLVPLVAHAAEAVPAGDAGPALQAAQFAGTGLVGLYSWVSSNQRAQRSDLDDAKRDFGERCGALEREVTGLKEHDRHAPTAAQMTDVIAKLAEVGALMRSTQQEAVKLGLRFDRYEEHMLESGR